MTQNSAFFLINIHDCVMNKYITVLKGFASFVYLAQMPALDINVLFISADHQVCSHNTFALPKWSTLAAVANTQCDKTQPGDRVENYNRMPEGIK